MTSISSNAATASQLLSTQSTKPKSPIDVAAALFGMSTSDLDAELKSGKSLNDVAKEKGVSQDDLDSALVKNMPPGLSSSGDATKIAQQMASQAGGPKAHHRGAHAAKDSAGQTTDSSSTSSSTTSSTSSSDLLGELSSLLNTDPDSLKSALSSGTSLSDLLSQSGVSLDSLANTLQQGMLLDTTA